MQQKLYQLLIFQDQTLIFYYDPLSIKQPNYEELQSLHRIQNLVGVSKSINALIKQIHPSQKTMFRNFKTREYQFSQYDTVNGLKIIAITTIRSDDKTQVVLKQVYDAYLNFVKKNYLFTVGEIIDVRPFKEKVAEIVKGLQEK